MNIIDRIEDIKSCIQKWRSEGYSIGFVPTMGYLHEGHASLIREAHLNNDKVIVSIFINPIQFGVNEDLSRYPRDLENDAKIVVSNGGNVIFNPSCDEMYPTNFSCRIDVYNLTEALCGLSRPHHFSGVTTVVSKLFNIIKPDKAYFGEKDAQQLLVIKKLVDDLNYDIEIVGCPIIRDNNGLALSSRNSYLSKSEYEEALVLSKAIAKASNLYNSGIYDTAIIIKEMTDIITTAPSATIDYIDIVSTYDLSHTDSVASGGLVAIAVYINQTRLIDNVTLK